MRGPSGIEYKLGFSAVVVGLGLFSYYVRELLASLFIFSVAFFFLGLIAALLFLISYASEKLAIWTPPASRSVIALSRRVVSSHTKP